MTMPKIKLKGKKTSQTADISTKQTYNISDCTILNDNVNPRKIIHFADLHIRPLQRHDEYRVVFDKLYDLIEQQNTPKDQLLTVITGDVFHEKNKLMSETIMLVRELFRKLSIFSTVLVIAGNHDLIEANKSRLDMLTPACDELGIHYLRTSGLYRYGDIIFSVSSLVDGKFITRCQIHTKPETDIYQYIALYHGAIIGSVTPGGRHISDPDGIKSTRFRNIKDFKGYDLTLLGDIHKYQTFNKDRIVYSGSLIQQNHGEPVNGHGVVIWNRCEQSSLWEHKFVEISNPYGFVDFLIEDNKLIKEPSVSIKNILHNGMYARFILTNTSFLQYEIIKNRMVDQNKYVFISVKVINRSKKHISSNNTDDEMKQTDISPDIFKLINNEIVGRNWTDHTEKLLELHKCYIEQVGGNNITQTKSRVVWKPLELEFCNLFAYGNNKIHKINFRDGTTSLTAPNRYGKTSLFNVLLYVLFDKVIDRITGKYNIVNNNEKSGWAKLILEYGNDRYEITRKATDKIRETDSNHATKSTKSIKINDKMFHGNWEEIVGNFKDFIYNNVLSTKFSSYDFFSKTEAEQMKYLKEQYNLGIFEKYLKLNNQKIKDIKNEIFRLNGSIEGSRELRKKLNDEILPESESDTSEINLLKDILNKQETNICDLEKETSKLNSRMVDCKMKLSNCLIEPNLDELYEELEQKQCQLKNIDMELPEETMDQLITKVEFLNKEVVRRGGKKYDGKCDSYDNIINNITRQIESISKKMSKIPCRLCKCDDNDNIIFDQEGVLMCKICNTIIKRNKYVHDEGKYTQIIYDKNNELKGLKKRLKKMSTIAVENTFSRNECQDKLDKLRDELMILISRTDDDLDHDKIEINSQIKILGKKKSKIKSYTPYNSTFFPNRDKDECIFEYETKMKAMKPKIVASSIKKSKLTYDELNKKEEKLLNKLQNMSRVKFNISESERDTHIQNQNEMRKSISNKIHRYIRVFTNNDYVLGTKEIKATIKFLKSLEKTICDSTSELNTVSKNVDIVQYQINLNEQIDNSDDNSIIDIKSDIESIRMQKNKLIYEDYKQIIDEIDHVKKIKSIDDKIEIFTKFLEIKELIQLWSERLAFNDKLKIKEEIENVIITINNYSVKLENIKKIQEWLNYKDNIKRIEEKLKKTERNVEIYLEIDSIGVSMALRDEMDQIDDIICKIKTAENIEPQFQRNLDIYDNINSIKIKIDKIDLKIKQIKTEMKLTIRQIRVYEKNEIRNDERKAEIKSLTNNINKCTNDLDNKIKQTKIHSMYNELMDKKCIPNQILHNKIGDIEKIINCIVSSYTDYKVITEFRGGDTKGGVIFHTNHKITGQRLCAERLSGYENVVFRLAFKIAINQLADNCKSNIFFIDEVLDCIDDENFSKLLPDVINKLKCFFSVVWVISHNDTSNFSDWQIKVSNKDPGKKELIWEQL